MKKTFSLIDGAMHGTVPLLGYCCSVTALAADTSSTDSTDSTGTYVADPNGTQYETLQAALDNAQNGDTVKLLTDVATSSNIWINTSSVTLDFDSHTTTSTSQYAICVGNQASATVVNGKLAGGSVSAVYTTANTTLTVKDCTLTGGGQSTVYNGGTTALVVENATLNHLHQLRPAGKAFAAIAFPLENASEALHGAVIDALADQQLRMESGEKIRADRKRLERDEKRVAELKRLFMKIYEDNASGRLNDERFDLLSQSYEAEQKLVGGGDRRLAAGDRGTGRTEREH